MRGARFVFRVDASQQIGNGHVMRCLALAVALRTRGAESWFICRAHRGHLGPEIEAAGFGLSLLPVRDADRLVATGSAHAAWSENDARTDCKETRAVLGDHRPDWLIVDHYAIDARWEAALRDACGRLAVIDDLADRAHDCDLLLDQNLGRASTDYLGRVPDGATLLLGPRFALLRPEFAALRNAGPPRRNTGVVRRILVSMGGADAPNATRDVLMALAESRLEPGASVDVVMGRHAPWIEDVRALADTFPFRCEVSSGVDDMALRMSRSDLAIGAGGSTTWERCALGLPSIVVSTADNQVSSARAVAAHGGHWHVGPVSSPGLVATIASAVRLALADHDSLSALGDRASELCDGVGADRVAGRLLDCRIVLRPAALGDAQLLHAWRSDPSTREHFVDPSEVSYGQHLAWLGSVLATDDRLLFVAEQGGRPVGCIRLDVNGSEAEVSIYLDPGMVGLGLGRRVIDSAVAYASTMLRGRVDRLTARVKPANTKSLGAFLAAGFLPEHQLLVRPVP